MWGSRVVSTAEAVLRRADRPEHPAEALTDKEFHVFLQLAQGHSVAEVADTFRLEEQAGLRRPDLTALR